MSCRIRELISSISACFNALVDAQPRWRLRSMTVPYQTQSSITGTKRTREGSDEAVHVQRPGKRLCRSSPEVLQAVRSDQVTLLHIAALAQPVGLVWHSSFLMNESYHRCTSVLVHEDHVALCKG